ncbi:hypothetical protein [Pseudorhodoplanes sp.]|uniref:hypothetical protein n=1 Tax=Pseudorhodoplanes sp. TaxID=1934341 RepID=UPI003D110898
MTRPTDHQLRTLKALTERYAAKRAQMRRLEAVVAAARATTGAKRQAFDRRITFVADPNALAGIATLYRGQTTPLQRRITYEYDRLLQAITDPLMPGVRPLKVDFHALTAQARPYLVAAYLDLKIGGVLPRLCLTRSNPEQGRLVYIVTGGAVDVAQWRAALPRISAWLGGHWTLTASTSNTVTLERRTPLPASIPFRPDMLGRGRLFLGFDSETQAAVRLPFADMTSGTFVPGAAGTGKSNALHILVQSILANMQLFSAVYLVDGKDGVAFNRYAGCHPKVKVLWEEADLWKLTSELVVTMRARNTAQREAGIDKTLKDFIAVVIDEMSTYTAKPSSDPKHADNKTHAQFIDELAMLAKRGRSTGIRLIITAQEPVVADIPANVRANCLTTISFKLPIDAHAIAVFGQLEGLPTDPRQLGQGRALIKHGLLGTMQTVQFPLIPPPAPRGRP